MSPRVKLRVFEAHGGICHISRLKIHVGQTWQCGPVKPLILGGEHRESNLAPVLTEPNKPEAAREFKAEGKIAGGEKTSRYQGQKAANSICGLCQGYTTEYSNQAAEIARWTV